MTRAYYNESDPYAAQWLRNLIAAGHIAPGEVDSRDVRDVCPDDLREFTQCHFFAGIGVWSHALRLAGWPDDREVWTGSCPCQPFSAAGSGAGFTDERHLWPSWFYLIEKRWPSVIFGEQVASKAADSWADLVQDDLEALDYAFGAVPFPAASVGAPHIRDRCYWVADTGGERRQQIAGNAFSNEAAHGRSRRNAQQPNGHNLTSSYGEDVCSLEHTASEQMGLSGRARQPRESYWSACDWVACTDGKARPVEPGTFPLAHGINGRVGRLRAYGNAIVAQAATEWVAAYMAIS